MDLGPNASINIVNSENPSSKTGPNIENVTKIFFRDQKSDWWETEIFISHKLQWLKKSLWRSPFLRISLKWFLECWICHANLFYKFFSLIISHMPILDKNISSNYCNIFKSCTIIFKKTSYHKRYIEEGVS